MIIVILILIFLLTLQIIMYFLIKNTTFCDNLNELKILNSNPLIKFEYLKLQKSSLYKSIQNTLNFKHKPLFIEKYLISTKSYILTLAKFIDFKINNDKKMYRAKNGVTTIENLAFIISKNIYKEKSYNLFKTYKKQFFSLSIKQKEDKLFKILLAKNLIKCGFLTHFTA